MALASQSITAIGTDLSCKKKNGAEDDLIFPCLLAYLQPFLRYNGSK